MPRWQSAIHRPVMPQGTAGWGKGKEFILCKAGSHNIKKLIPLRYPWAREYNSRLHTSLLGGLVLNRDSLLFPHVELLTSSTKMDEGLTWPRRDLNPGPFDPRLSTLLTELSHHYKGTINKVLVLTKKLREFQDYCLAITIKHSKSNYSYGVK